MSTAPGTQVPGRGSGRGLLLLVLALAGLLGAVRLATLPPDEHEVLVLRTAQEMAQRSDWVVPYFNGEPRLNKPPMSYWMTALVAAADDLASRVQPWHGRLVSLLAGLGLVALAWLGGVRLFGDRATALWAAALTATTAGWFSYTHDARPDMLYALFCSAGFIAFVLAREAVSGRLRTGPCLLMWAAYGLATLTKGPQLPFMLLLAQVLWLARTSPRGWRALGGLCWLRGVALLLALALPWWLLLEGRLADGAVERSQLSGSLLRPGFEHIFNGYYLYRPLQLVLPWLVLVPAGWMTAWRVAWAGGRHAATRDAVSLLTLSLAVPALVLSLGPQQRYFYMLPVLVPMMLLAAHGWVLLAARWPRARAGVAAAQGLVLLAAAAWVVDAGGRPGDAGWLLGATLLAAVAAWRGRARWCAGLLAAELALAAATFAVAATHGVLWSDDRRHTAALGASAAEQVPASAPLFAYRLTPAVYVYETQRRIPRLAEPGVLAARLAQAPGGALWLLMETREAVAVSGLGRLEPIRLMPAGAPDRAGLYRLGQRRADGGKIQK